MGIAGEPTAALSHDEIVARLVQLGAERAVFAVKQMTTFELQQQRAQMAQAKAASQAAAPKTLQKAPPVRRFGHGKRLESDRMTVT